MNKMYSGLQPIMIVLDPVEEQGGYRLCSVPLQDAARRYRSRRGQIFLGRRWVAENWLAGVSQSVARKRWFSVSPVDGRWFRMDQALPPRTGPAEWKHVELVLEQILYGSIAVAIDVGGDRHNFVLDDFDDEISLLGSFVRLLRQGRSASAALADRTDTIVTVESETGSDCARLIIQRLHETRPLVDVWTSRASLVAQFSRLTVDIALNHRLDRHFLAQGDGTCDAYDAVGDHAEAEAKALGLDWDAAEEWVADRLCERLPLTLPARRRVQKIKRKLLRDATRL